MNEGDDTPILDAVTDFAKNLFHIPVPPHGRIAIVSSQYNIYDFIILFLRILLLKLFS